MKDAKKSPINGINIRLASAVSFVIFAVLGATGGYLMGRLFESGARWLLRGLFTALAIWAFIHILYAVDFVAYAIAKKKNDE